MRQKENAFYFTSMDDTIDIVLLKEVHTSYPLHTHARHYTLGIVIDGALLIETAANTYVCNADNLFTIPIDMPHSIKASSDQPYTLLSFCIHQDYLIHTELNQIKLAIHEKLKHLFDNEKTIENYARLLADGLLLLFAHTLKNISDVSYSMDIKNKLIEVPEAVFSIQDMSNEICVSSFHMIRQFKKEIGLTPHQFQIQCRIRKAQKMLLSDKTIAEVALDTGFCDQSHFVRCFKKIVGMTPASYQKNASFSKVQE